MNDLISITGDVIDGAETGTAIALPTATSLEAGNWFALADALIDGKVPHTQVML